MTSSRVRAPRGSSPVQSAPVEADVVDDTVVAEVPVVDLRQDVLIAEIVAAGWSVKVEPMRVLATCDGFAPWTACCSSSYEAAAVLHQALVVNAGTRLRRTALPPVVEVAAVVGDGADIDFEAV